MAIPSVQISLLLLLLGQLYYYNYEAYALLPSICDIAH